MNAPFKITKEMRAQVCTLVAVGLTHWQIALCMEMSRETLEMYFPDELKDGHALFRGELTKMVRKAARAGNVAAQKHLDRMSRRDLLPAPRPPSKKEFKAREADRAMQFSEWSKCLATIEPPRD